MEGSITNLQNPVMPVIPQDIKQPDASALKPKDEFQNLLKNKESETAKDIPKEESKEEPKETSKEESKEATAGIQGDAMQLIHLFDPARLKIWLGNMSNTTDAANAVIGQGGGLAETTEVQNQVSGNVTALPNVEAMPNVEVPVANASGQTDAANSEVKTEITTGMPMMQEEVGIEEKMDIPTAAVTDTKAAGEMDAIVEVKDNNSTGQTAKAEIPVHQEDTPVQKTDTPVNQEDAPVQKTDIPVQRADTQVQKTDIPVALISGDKQISAKSFDSTVNDSAAISTLVSELKGVNETSPKEEQQNEQSPQEHNKTLLESVVSQTAEPSGRGAAFRTPQAAAQETVHVNVRQPEEIPQKLADNLIAKLDTRQKEIEIQLEPHNLGKIAIKVTYGQHNTAISIACSNTKTLELLAQSAKDIGAIIETNLGSPTTIFVEKNVENYLDQNKQDNSGQDRGQQEQKNQEQNNRNQQDERLDFIQQLRLGLAGGSGQMYQNNY